MFSFMKGTIKFTIPFIFAQRAIQISFLKSKYVNNTSFYQLQTTNIRNSHVSCYLFFTNSTTSFIILWANSDFFILGISLGSL